MSRHHPPPDPRKVRQAAAGAFALAVLAIVGGVLMATSQSVGVQQELGEGKQVAEQQRDAAGAQAASLATQIRQACAAGELKGAVCDEAAQVEATPIPGPPGPRGGTGPAGSEGPAGREGGQGPGGQAGAPGERGPAGQMGERGPAGADGEAGKAGPAGPEGPAGPAGPQGEKGDPGADSTVPGPEGPEGPPGPACPSGEHRETVSYGLNGPSGTACVAD